MGIDVCLLPYWSDTDRDAFALDVLHLERDYDLQEAIRGLRARDVPRHFRCPMASSPDGGRRYGEVTEDAYGDPLKYVRAGDLAALADGLCENAASRNRAALAYVGALPKGWPIVVFWR